MFSATELASLKWLIPRYLEVIGGDPRDLSLGGIGSSHEAVASPAP